MDKFDLDILRLLQRDCRMTAEAMSDHISLSPAAIQKRVKKLREGNVIQSEIAVLSPKRLGLTMTVIVNVELEREDLAVLEAFKRQMRKAENVQQCYYTTGEADFILIVVVEDIQAYEKFTHDYFFGNKVVRKFKSNIVMDPVKIGLSVPVE